MVNLLLMIFLTCQNSYASNYSEAAKKASEAFYKQSGLDVMVNKVEKRYIPKTVKVYGGWLIAVQDCIVNERFTYIWRHTF